MSSHSSSKKIQKYNENKLFRGNPIRIKDISISFSKFFGHQDSPDIYSGNEKIPFCRRNPEYQNILKNEFII
ncbi:MAG: hypothetical protein ACFFA6_07810 [Promethearchaeota archaeon]